jgi:hypothetical protein
MRSLIVTAVLFLTGAALAQEGDLNATIGGKGATLGEAKGKCTVPPTLKEALDRLEQDYTKFSKRNDALPKEVMFRRPDVPRAEIGPEWKLMDEMIRNGGPDDWLVAAGKSGGDVTKVLAEVRPFLDGTHCDRAEWQALAMRIEPLAANIAKRHRRAKSILEAVETNYITWGNRIRKTLKPQGADHGLVAQLLEVLGMKSDKAEATSILGSLALLNVTAMNYVSDTHPGVWAGGASAAINTWKVISASLRLGELLNLDYKLMPFYLETAETFAWLQPLVDNHYRLEDDAYGIVALVRSHYPFPVD